MSFSNFPTKCLAMAALAVVAACDSESTSASSGPLVVDVPAGAVQAAVQRAIPNADGSVTYSVRVMAKDVKVSSFSGTVTFEPGAFELVSVGKPTQNDESHIVNQTDFANGQIRFAVFTPTVLSGIDSGAGVEAFSFTVKPLRPESAANVVASLDVVGKETGTAVAAERIFASPGVMDVAGKLVK
jgi:hypothetical protein